MTEIRPFPALHYNTEKIPDMNRVVCPPYDVISPKQQDGYHNSSPYNFIRILLGKERPDDDAKNNRYTRAKDIFDQWQQEGILVPDQEDCIYFYKQEFKVMGEKYDRLGFISLMKLSSDKDSRVYPHENTHAQAKEDRFKLWRALSANLSCIFVCYSDPERKINQYFTKEISSQSPFLDVVDDDKVRHVVWRVTDPKVINLVARSMAPQQLFIADGHHRYEVAKAYRDWKLSKVAKATGKEPFQYVMTYFTNMDSRGLRIFPMHRIVKTFPKKIDFLEEFFRIDKVRSKEELAVLLGRAGRNETAFGLLTDEGLRMLRLKSQLLVEKIIKDGSPEFKRLDATILKHFVFDRTGVKSEDIIYTKDLSEVVRMVEDGKAQAGFIMNPVKISQLKSIALNGERMPPKTTYFYPKVLSGLTIYKMS